MKALLIKALSSTNHLPARFKVTIHGQKPFTISQESMSFNYNSADCLQLQAAHQALLYWDMGRVIDENNLFIGQLPNGDYVATLSNKRDLFRAEILVRDETHTFYYSGSKLNATIAAQAKAIQLGGFEPLITEVKHYIGDAEYKRV